MKRCVQILILIALLPSFGVAREETLEERKKRITRKYMRERTQLTQSDMYVPENIAEDEQVTDSEGFKELKPAFEKQEEGTRPAMPRPPPPAMQSETTDNWLLTDPALDEDPFADPFDPYGNATGTETKSDYWAMYGGRPSEAKTSTSTSDREEAYRKRLQQSFGLGERNQDRFENWETRNRTDIFGQQQQSYPGQEDSSVRTYSSGFGTPPRTSYGASPETGLLNTPFSRSSSSEETNPRERQQLTPRKSISPFNRTPQGQQPALQPKQQYTQPDTLQQWKDRNKSWDPTADDAYLNELMDRNKR